MLVPEFKPRPGQIDYTHARRAPVFNSIVKHGGKILLVRRNEKMHFHPGVWSGISGFLDEPSKTIGEKVKEELREETGIEEHNIISIQEGDIFEQEEVLYGKTWIVHPVLVDVATDVVHLDWEAEKYAWIDPHEIWSFDLLPGFDAVAKSFFHF